MVLMAGHCEQAGDYVLVMPPPARAQPQPCGVAPHAASRLKWKCTPSLVSLRVLPLRVWLQSCRLLPYVATRVTV